MIALLVGRKLISEAARLRELLGRHGFDSVLAADEDAARQELKRIGYPPPRCFVVDLPPAAAAAFLAEMRLVPQLFAVPMLWVAESVSEALFVDGFHFGADDVVVRGDLAAIARRLPLLAAVDPAARHEAKGGHVLVAHPDATRRTLIARALRLAGFDVALADDAAPERFRDSALVLAVVSRRLVPRRREQGHVKRLILDDRWEASAPPRRLGEEAILAEGAPLYDLTILASELSRPALADLRSSRRVLHHSLCSFREEGSFEPRFGVTCNLSREGLYVRTMEPVDIGRRLWVELRPGLDAKSVHLRANAVWVRRPDAPFASPAPPGFGIHIDESETARGDWRAYQAAWKAIERRQRSRRRPKS